MSEHHDTDSMDIDTAASTDSESSTVPESSAAAGSDSSEQESGDGSHGSKGALGETKQRNHPGPIYDAVFHTEVERLPRPIIWLVNYLFGTSFTGEEEIYHVATEYSKRSSDGKPQTVRADSHFVIVARDKDGRAFHIECQLRRDKTILLRIAEYDILQALNSASSDDHSVRLTLPDSAVILLDSSAKQDDLWQYEVRNSKGETLVQDVKVLSLRDTPLNSLYQKGLLALLPFYLFRHGDKLKQLEQTAEGREQLILEGEDVREHIMADKNLGLGEKQRLRELTADVIRTLVKNADIKESMEDIMMPQTIELVTDQFGAAYRSEGRDEGMREGKTQTLYRLVRAGKLSVADAADDLGVSEDKFRRDMAEAKF